MKKAWKRGSWCFLRIVCPSPVTWKTNCLLKTRWSIQNYTNVVTRFSLKVIRFSGNCSSPFSVTALLRLEKLKTFCPLFRINICPRRHQDTSWSCKIKDTVTSINFNAKIIFLDSRLKTFIRACVQQVFLSLSARCSVDFVSTDPCHFCPISPSKTVCFWLIRIM